MPIYPNYHVTDGAHAVAVERNRQMDVVGYDGAHDEQWTAGELTAAASCYIRANEQLEITIPTQIRELLQLARAISSNGSVGLKVGDLFRLADDMKKNPVAFVDPTGWPWDMDTFRPSVDPKLNLEKAGALIAAELDRVLDAERI